MTLQSIHPSRSATCAAVLMMSIGGLALMQAAAATEAYATQTGKACMACHTTSTGGALNAVGDAFKEKADKPPPPSAAPTVAK